jgi:hypothetical protein
MEASMPTAGRFRVPAAAASLALYMLACTGGGAEEQPASLSGSSNLSGTWQGSLGGQASRLDLTQRGTELTGSLDGMALLGRAGAGTFTFTLSGGVRCPVAATGSGTMKALGDRDRIELSYYGASCAGGGLSAVGRLDRLSCDVGRVLCGPLHTATLTPYCAELARDAANCGSCGNECQAYQACTAGSCVIPACSAGVRLETPSQYPAAWAPRGLTAGDVDGDGARDVVVAGWDDGWSSGRLVVLRGDGHGGLSEPVSTPLSPAPGTIALGDLDGDGVLDAAAWAGELSGLQKVIILLGDGDGAFRAGGSYPVAGPDLPAYAAPVRLVALADLDGDGVLDLVSRSGPAPSLQVRLGTGDGTFGPATDYALADSPTALLAADLDGDGAVDLAAAPGQYAGSPLLYVLLGNGDGTFRAPIETQGVTWVHDVAAGDFDEDGVPDLAVGGQYHGLAVLLGRGDGTFEPPLLAARREQGPGLGLAVEDLDGDGHLDVAIATGSDLEIVLGRGDGTFAAGVRFPVRWDDRSQGGAMAVAAADLDGDGKPDLMSASYLETVRVFLACGP